MTVYLFLNSNDSTSFHPSNNPDDFIVTLPKPYVLDGCWECALLEMNIELINDIALPRVHLCCDIVEDSYVRNNVTHPESTRAYPRTKYLADDLRSSLLSQRFKTGNS